MSENINHKLVVCGDIHLQCSEPKKSQGSDFLNWLFNQDFNNENNSLLMIGDLCEINSPYELYAIYVDYLVNKSKFKTVYIINGNHDGFSQSTVLSLFAPLKNVEVITEWKTLKFYNCNLIMLPHFNHEGTDKVSMIELYSNLYKTVTEEFDYGFGHIEDQTQHFSKRYPDTSKLKVKQWMNGHVHTPTIQNGGNYLGSATLNSSTESGNTKYLAIIDGETKEYELIEVPKFLEYYEVSYPDPLPKIDTKYGLFLVRNSLDKKVTEEEYSKQAEELGFKFYARKILSKKSKVLEVGEVEKTENLTFDDFADSVELDDSIRDICKEVIKLKGEE